MQSEESKAPLGTTSAGLSTTVNTNSDGTSFDLCSIQAVHCVGCFVWAVEFYSTPSTGTPFLVHLYHGRSGAIEKLGKVVSGGCPWQVTYIQGAAGEVKVFVVVSVGRFGFATVNAYNNFASVDISAVGAFDGALGISFAVEANDAVATGATVFADDDLSTGAVVWAVDTRQVVRRGGPWQVTDED